MDSFDYIVVGGGTAGAVIASRLSERPGERVLLLEAGGDDTSPLLAIPAGFVATVNDRRFSWRYETAPLASLGGRRLPCPRGRVLGGSSSINGMIYVFGQDADYDAWRDLGNPGWGAAEMRAALKRAVRQTRDADGGYAGAVRVSDCASQDPLSAAFERAAIEYGLPRNPDFNGAAQEGVGYYQFNIAGGRRQSASRAYLREARRRPNLRVVTGALAESIVLSGRRATGVRYRVGGARRTATAAREVILAAGAIGSPQLLLLSGIGPADELRALGIAPALDLPGVGQNLQDHFLVRSSWEVRGLPSMNRLRSPLAQLRAVAEWAVTRRGPLANGPCTVGAFFRTRPELDRPDVQLHFVPCSFDVVPGSRSGQELHRFDGMTAGVYQLRPEGRGEVTLASRDARDAPVIAPAHLETETDRRTAIAALRVQRALFEQPALASVRVREVEPGPDVADDDAWLDFARRTGESAHHVCGTCKMGTDAAAVVDPELRVRGVAGLRVIDASIMPAIVSGNTHAATLAIAERGAELVTGTQFAEAAQ
jgi:choline dehydrogenase